MYIVDNLIDLYDNSPKDSINSVLSKYFLLNARKMNNKKLVVVSKETNISSSSINRFCKNAGYDTFSSFCAILSLDIQEIDYQLSHFFHNIYFNIDQETQIKLDQIVKDLQHTKKIIIYGSPKYTGYFDSLIKYLFLNGICVERCKGWNIKEKENIFLNTDPTDLMILIDPRYSIQVYLEENGTSLGSIKSISKADAKKYFFGISNKDFMNIKAIKLIKQDNYGYTLSCIDYINYILMQLIGEKNNEHSYL